MKNAKSNNMLTLRAGVAAGMALISAVHAQTSGGAPVQASQATVTQRDGQDPVSAFIDSYISKSEKAASTLDAAGLSEFYQAQLGEALAVVTAHPKSAQLDDVLGIAATLAFGIKDFGQAESLALQASQAAGMWTMQSFWLKAAGEYAQAFKTEAATARARDHFQRAIEISVQPIHRDELKSSQLAAVNLSSCAIKLAQIESARSNPTAALNVLTPVREVIATLPQELQSNLATSHHGVEGLAGMEVDAAAAAGELQRGIAALQVIYNLSTKRSPASTHADRFARIAATAGKVYAETASLALAALQPDPWTPALELRIGMDQVRRGFPAEALAIAEKLLANSVPALEAIDAEQTARGLMPEGSGGHISALYALVGSTSLALGDTNRANAMLTLIADRFPLDPQRKSLADQIMINQLHRTRGQGDANPAR
jgi:hypothetical protein